MTQPLDGVRVLDLTSMVSGPTATVVLADQGAEVIKLERPGQGDHTRNVSTRRGGFAASYLNNNRSKRSIALDLKDPRGVEAALRLASRSDVVVQNFRPGVAERIGLGEEAVRAVRADIVYVSISGFGFEGPYAQKPVYDPLIQSVSGLTTVQAGSDAERPRLVRTILPDKLTGYVAAQAITAALLQRHRTGEGQHIRLSMLDAVVAFLWGSDMSGYTFVGSEETEARPQSFIDLIYETADGYVSVAVQSDREWEALIRAFDKPEWRDDPRFSTVADRQRNIDDRLALTQEVLLTDTAEAWIERLEAEGVPCAPVLTRREMIAHPQIEANETVMEYDHPQAGRLRQARPAPRFSGAPWAEPRPAPALGADTRAVLAEAGMDEAAIEALIADGVAAEGEPEVGA
ncbi:MAG: CaiB/BaiF CoA transferase family protein [Paracoccaceae bacterium]